MNKLISRFIIFLSVAVLSVAAFAGGSSPGLYYGQVPTAAQWNSYFASKLDYTPGAANTITYWDGAGSLLNAPVSGNCTMSAGVFTCTTPTSTNLAGGTTGAIPYQSAVSSTTFLSGNTTTTPEFVTSTGTGSAALPPTLTGSTGSGSVVLSSSPTIVSPNFASGVSITSGVVNTSAVNGDQFLVTNDPSPYRKGAWPTTASGALYTLFGNQFLMEYWSHNTALDGSGNFVVRGDTGTCTVGGFAENDFIKIFSAPSGTAGTACSFGATPTYSLNTATGDVAITGAYSGAGTNLTGTAAGLSIGGNSATATKLATARAINGINFDGSAAITVPATIGTSTFAALPAAASNTGVQYRVTNIGTGNSIWYSNGTQWHPVGGQAKLSQDAIPIGLPPGNGTNTGLQFTNTTGAFTLTTTTFQNAYTGGIWLWMPIGAFDGVNPTSAAFYWAVMSTTSAGQLYTATYQAGIPTGLVQATTTASRWLTQTAGAAITARSITVVGGSMGPNGMLAIEGVASYSNSSNAKTIAIVFGGNTNSAVNPTTTNGYNFYSRIRNRGVVNSQVSGFPMNAGANIGTALAWTATDTSVDQILAITLQLTSNTDYAIIEGSNIIMTPGF